MDQIHVPLGGPAHDNNSPVNRRVIASPFARERKKIVCGRNPVEKELPLTVRDRSRGKRQQHMFEVVIHLWEPTVARWERRSYTVPVWLRSTISAGSSMTRRSFGDPRSEIWRNRCGDRAGDGVGDFGPDRPGADRIH